MSTAGQYKDDVSDDVHVCQKIFNTLMMALAFPGTRRKFDPLVLTHISPDYSFVMQPLLALLDLETRHHIFAENPELKHNCEMYLEANTSSSSCGLEEADFILCLEETAKPFYHRINRGSLSSPDDGATLVYHVDSITPLEQGTPARGTGFSLKGPGIKETISLEVQGLGPDEPALWQSSRQDYPLGIDVLLVSSTGDCVGIPRSVTIIQPGVN